MKIQALYLSLGYFKSKIEMKFGVVIFPGSNCDQDIIYVLRDILGHDVTELWHKDTDLKGVEAVMIPGGFSFGDYLRSGALANHSPIMKKVIEFAHGGGLVMGICNGFQILCESGLLPGTLLHNDNQKFICKNTHIMPDNNHSAINKHLDRNTPLMIPIAHGEGRYFAPEDTLAEMRLNNQIIFRYCNERGEMSSDYNPNGSVENIAGVCNSKHNVFGMMPHPERASDEELGNTDGKLIIESLIRAWQERFYN